MGYLVKYLPELGWDPSIITEDVSESGNFLSLSEGGNVIKVFLDNSKEPKTKIGKIWRLINQYKFYRNNKKPFVDAALKNFVADQVSIILVSTSWNLFILEAGLELALKWNKPLVADLRDIHEQRPKGPVLESSYKDYFIYKKNNFFLGRVLKLRNKALGKVSAITTVSPWHLEELSRYNQNVNLIFNGFDPEIHYPDPNRNQSQFKITYTGTINSIELRNPTFLFKAVEVLAREEIITPDLFRIKFYIPEKDELLLRKLPDFNSIIGYVDFYRFVEHSRVPLILNDSCIVLLLTNLTNEDGPKGVNSTTRFYEYLGVERPILCVRSDESLMENSIKESKAGISARSVDEAYNFILEKWDEWKLNGYTTVIINQKYKQQFSRKLQAKQFATLFNEIISTQEIAG
jgi:hypothetical protein